VGSRSTLGDHPGVVDARARRLFVCLFIYLFIVYIALRAFIRFGVIEGGWYAISDRGVFVLVPSVRTEVAGHMTHAMELFGSPFSEP
jgi:hypothetical protein